MTVLSISNQLSVLQEIFLQEWTHDAHCLIDKRHAFTVRHPTGAQDVFSQLGVFVEKVSLLFPSAGHLQKAPESCLHTCNVFPFLLNWVIVKPALFF